MACGKQIPWSDLVPIIGYMGVRGKCRYCRTSIGVWTYAGELLPAIVLPLLLFSGLSWPSALATVFVLGHLYISMTTDYNFHLLDHENAVFIAGWSFFAVIFDGGIDALYRSALTGGAAFLIMGFLYIIAGSGRMGFGDVILGSILAFFTGFPWALVLFNVAAGGAVIYSLLVLKDRKLAIPFGVFLSISAWIAVIVHALFRMKIGYI
jgi:prepilin signal peptidase PulO-like enzyme (type II secretory pathway)